MMIRAPAPAKTRAVARPRPLPAPVISATLPSNSPIIGSLFSLLVRALPRPRSQAPNAASSGSERSPNQPAFKCFVVEVFGQEHIRDPATQHDANSLAAFQLGGFCRIPENGGALFRLSTDDCVDLQLGLLIDAARGVVEQKDIRRIGERAAHENFLLRAAAQTGDSIR